MPYAYLPIAAMCVCCNRKGFAHVHDQFMLGDTILVAPVAAKGASGRAVKLPAGRWSAQGAWAAHTGTLEGPADVDVAAAGPVPSAASKGGGSGGSDRAPSVAPQGLLWFRREGGEQ